MRTVFITGILICLVFLGCNRPNRSRSSDDQIDSYAKKSLNAINKIDKRILEDFAGETRRVETNPDKIFGGTENRILALLSAIADRGHDVEWDSVEKQFYFIKKGKEGFIARRRAGYVDGTDKKALLKLIKENDKRMEDDPR